MLGYLDTNLSLKKIKFSKGKINKLQKLYLEIKIKFLKTYYPFF